MPEPQPLWTVEQLAAYLGYSSATINRLVSEEPDKLPPWVPGLRPRWVPSLVEAWAIEHSRGHAARRGRPRRST